MLQRFRPAGKFRFRSGSGSVFRRMEVACEARTGAFAQHLKRLTSTAPRGNNCGPLDTPTCSIRPGLHLEVDTSTRSRDAFTPEQCNNLALGKTKRAQGMPGDDLTHGPPAIKKQAGSHHRFSQINRHSLRDGLRLISRSPRGPGFLAPVASVMRKHRR